MNIGIIRPYEVDYNPLDIKDLKDAIKSLGHNSSDIYIDKLGVEIKKGGMKFTQITDNKGSQNIDVDCAFLRHLGMFRDYEQFGSRIWSVRAMEQSGICVINEVLSWMLASDKLASFTTLAKANLPIPRTFLSEDMIGAYNAAKGMNEVVIKRVTGSMGYGVFRVKGEDFAMHVFSYLNGMSKPIYMQEYLKKKGSGDYRIIVVGGKVLGAEFRKGVDWKSNIAQGAKPIKAKPNQEMKEIAIKATKALGLDYAGIDIADTKDGYTILDVNPTMSWQGFKKVNKIDVAKALIEHLILKSKS